MSGSPAQLHGAGFYASDAEFRALIVPFVEAGLAAGEPVIIGYDERKSDLLRSWLADPSAVTFVAERGLYSTPARTIASYRRMFDEHVARGARRIRIAGDVPHAGNGGRFHGWDRYESAVNSVWRDFPVHSLCLYDATTVSAVVREVVERTHPHLHSADGGAAPNSGYDETFTGLPAAPDPIEATAPLVHIADAAPAEARRAVEEVARGRVADQVLDDLVFGVSEAATNALLHGRAPTAVTLWASADRVVAHVRDSGGGPTDPLAGLVPADRATGGLGMWLTHQLDIDVTLIPQADGFTVRLRGGAIG